MPSGDNQRRNQSNASRRSFIATVGGAGVAASLAGCAGILDDGDGGDDDGDDGDDGGNELGDPVDTLLYESLVESVHPNRYQWTTMHTEELEDFGFDVEIEYRQPNAYVEVGFNEREFDLYPLRWGDGFDPDRVLGDFFSAAALEEGGGNVSGYEDDEYEEMLENQRTALDSDERQQIVHDMQAKVIEDEHAITPVFVMPRPMPYNSERYQNVTLQPENGLASLWNLLSMEPTSEGDSTITMGEVESVDHFNPFGTIQRGDRNVQRHVFDRLAQVPADGGPPEPWAAESWEWPDDTTLEITLRDDLMWHDGETIDAEDVVFSYEFSQDVPARESTLSNINNIEAETDVDITFELDQPSAPFETQVLAGRNASLVPPQQWEDIDPGAAGEEGLGADAIGSGPWQVSDFTAGESLSLEAFGDHFNPPNLDRVDRIQYADVSSAVGDIEAEAVDMLTFDIRFDDIETLEGLDYVTVEMPQMTSIHYLTYNMRRDLFQEENVRRALGHVLPKAEANDVALIGRGELVDTCFSPSLEFWHNGDLEEFRYDTDRAQELLEDAGFGWDGDQVHYPADW